MNPVLGGSPAGSMNNNCRNVTGSYNKAWNNCNVSVSDEKRQVLEWLSPLTSRERHQAVRDARADGIGDWLLRTEKFSTWHTLEDGARPEKPVLLCYGDPGVGKTYISSLVIDELSDEIGKGSEAVAYVYCDFTQDGQSAKTVLASVLRQVVGALLRIPDEVQKAFEHAKTQVDGCGLRLPEIVELLIASLSRLQKGFVCVDALDEFPSKRRAELWRSLQSIVHRSTECRLFLTGRPQIATEAGGYFPERVDMVIIIPPFDDIGLYIEKRLNEDLDLNAMDNKLRAEIFRVVPVRVSGILLLASINMDAILAEATVRRRRQELNSMTTGLGLQDAYNSTLDRIKQQGGGKSKLGMEALMWVSHCERPLKSEELCHALGVELGTREFNMDNVPSIQAVLGYTLGLVTFDKKASTVRILHLTLRDYLSEHPTLFVTAHSMTAHSMMAEVCLTYLNTRGVRALPPNPDKDWQAPPFLEYATCFWGTHASIGMTKPVEYLALRLLERYENHVSAVILCRGRIPKYFCDKAVQRISGLHCIALWGIAEIASSMLEVKRWDINAQDSDRGTPLSWAVKYGNDRVAELFLKQGDIEPEKVIRSGRTVLSLAAECGNECVVKLLLERGDVNPDSVDEGGRTPLSYAANSGRGSVVKLLLERGDVNPNSIDKECLTPLLYAVTCDNEQVSIVKEFLKHEDINPDSADSYGRTALSYAASLEFEGVAKLLLERGDVNPDSADDNGRTPLSVAAEWGHEAIGELLLDCGDVNPNSMDRAGLTPLLHAVGLDCEQENWSMVELLLERRDVNPNLSDGNGRTPLSFAAQSGWEEAVKLLLKRGDVDPNSVDGHGLTPLLHSMERKWKGWDPEGIVRLLLGRGDVNPNLSDNNGRTPLSLATSRGYQGTVKLLLERGDVNPNASDNNGRTPLLFAAFGGRERILELLLWHVDVNPDAPDNNGRTPLLFAAWGGHEGVVKLLLEHGGVDPNSTDRWGLTPLSSATRQGYQVALKLLSEYGNSVPKS